MKYLLVLLVIVVAVGIWRNNRRAEREATPPPPPAPPPASGTPARMVSCAHCGLHLPATDAVQGRSGAYCSPEHRQLSEG